MAQPSRRSGPVDIHIGERIRELRTKRGVSQEALGAALGVAFQQIQKYESGVNRISAGRLWLLCRELKVPIAPIFEGVTESMFTGAKRGGKAKR